MDYVERQQSFAGVGAFYCTMYEAIDRPQGGPREIREALAESEFFETLGVRPVTGRGVHAGGGGQRRAPYVFS